MPGRSAPERRSSKTCRATNSTLEAMSSTSMWAGSVRNSMVRESRRCEMSGTAYSRASRVLITGWVAFVVTNIGLMFAFSGAETIPFHLVWITFALIYGIHRARGAVGDSADGGAFPGDGLAREAPPDR